MAEVDGRTARALRTREAIVGASVALVAEGDLRPTAPRIAERAGVSVRSVFQHFDDLEGLYAAVADEWVARLGARPSRVDASLPIEQRVHEVVETRSRVLEAITPVRRAAAVHAPFSTEVRSRLQRGHDMLREEIERLFADELERRETNERVTVLDALDTVLSWPSWENLRTACGRSDAESRVVIEHLVRGILGLGTAHQ